MNRIKRYPILTRLLPFVVLFGLIVPSAAVMADEDYQEALRQTEDQWKAVRETMQQSKGKFDDFSKKYQEYEDIVFSRDMEDGIELARQLFNLEKSQTGVAKQKLSELRDMFNQLDASGLKTKLKKVSDGLGFADKVAGEVENVWEFSKKFDPDHAKDNPTYGLRLIGDLLKESAGKMEKIPLVGQILGKWISAYGEVAGDFANALDRLGKKIEEFRGGSLCGQLGYKQDQQEAFKTASKAGEDCLTYFAVGIFPRMRGETYEGNASYFLYDPATRRGYFSPLGTTDKVYRWHELLLDRVALDPDWLASRSNLLKPEVEQRARQYYALFAGWRDRTEPGWVIIDKLDMEQDAYFYGRLDEETFVANYVIAKKHHDAIEEIVKKYEKYVFIGGAVYESIDGAQRTSPDATVQFTVGGKSYSERTTASGDYGIVMEGKVNDAVQEKVTKEGFDPIERDGRIPQRAILGQNYTLLKEAMTVVITGTVSMTAKEGEAATPVLGATVVASAAESESLGSATSGGDGSYQLTVKTAQGVEVTCIATKDGAAGSASVTVTGEAHPGVDITITAEEEKVEKLTWSINVMVVDDNGKPLPGATVTGTGEVAAVTAGADGSAIVGPIDIPDTYPDEPFAVTLTPTVVVQGGAKVGGGGVAVTYEGQTPSAVTLSIPVVIPQAVTITGTVTDANGVPVDGAVVTGDGQSATTSAGAYSLGPFMLVKDSTVNVSATMDDGTNKFSGGPVPCLFDGANTSIGGITIVLNMESETDVTITGFVKDLDSKPLQGAAVSAATASATTDGAGQYTLIATGHKLGTPLIVSASIADKDGVSVAGQAEVTPMSENAMAPTIIINVKQEDVYEVTISGTVVDENSAGVAGATITAGAVSTTSGGSGEFALPLLEMTANESVPVSAVYTDGQDNYAGGPVSVTFDGTNTAIGGVVIVVKKEKATTVTITGTVTSTDGAAVNGATVSGGGQTASTDASGHFSLPPFEHELGAPVAISASTFNADGNPVGASSSVTPTSSSASVQLAIDMQSVSDDELDDLIDELEDDLDDTAVDFSGLLADFNLTVSDLDAIAGEVTSNIDYLEQRIRELGAEVCSAGDASYALSAAANGLETYDFTLGSLPGIYAQLSVPEAAEAGVDVSGVDAAFSRVVGQAEALEAAYAGAMAQYSVYECDEDAAQADAGDKADEDADPDDVESGADDGGGVEVCGDGIDNDGNGEIDECSAGCCDKNVQVTVTDCGLAADDIFLVAIDGGDVGVTPKGAANTFNVELSPGSHSVTVTCLDDGGDPLGSDIGTACVSVIVYGTDAGIGGGELSIAYGGSADVGFLVPEGPAKTTVPQVFDGSTLQTLEKRK